jgi:hypothetical protein
MGFPASSAHAPSPSAQLTYSRPLRGQQQPSTPHHKAHLLAAVAPLPSCHINHPHCRSAHTAAVDPVVAAEILPYTLCYIHVTYAPSHLASTRLVCMAGSPSEPVLQARSDLTSCCPCRPCLLPACLAVQSHLRVQQTCSTRCSCECGRGLCACCSHPGRRLPRRTVTPAGAVQQMYSNCCWARRVLAT